MNMIKVLDPITIDKIAAGEVVERPASIVKELVENAIDANATQITVEIEEGGIALIRITDNGCGMAKEDIPRAFLRHATSKIDSAEDLSHLESLGFRGEALSSIAAVAKVEVRTKRAEDAIGFRYEIAGGSPKEVEEIGAKDGTTFFIRHLFYNTPARRKFLKTAMTEGAHIADLMTRMALSHPDIAFLFINGGQTRLQTSGNGSVKDIIYHVYGREVASNLMEVRESSGGISIEGYIGKPLISRGNRNYETYFINHRYIKNGILSKAIEDAYKGFTMQHKYPFVALHLEVDSEKVDVNVHPSKMEVRFGNHQEIYKAVFEAISGALHRQELIPHVELEEKANRQSRENPGEASGRWEAPQKKEEKNLDYFMGKMRERVESYHRRNSAAEVEVLDQIFRPDIQTDRIREQVRYGKSSGNAEPLKEGAEPRATEGIKPEAVGGANPREEAERNAEASWGVETNRSIATNHSTEVSRSAEAVWNQGTNRNPEGSQNPEAGQNIEVDRSVEAGRIVEANRNPEINRSAEVSRSMGGYQSTEANRSEGTALREKMPGNRQELPAGKEEQLNLFEENLLKREIRAEYRLIGQAFDTYWLVEFQEQLYIIDQHAAHERVLYEQTMERLQTHSVCSQIIAPPMILTLDMKEAHILESHLEQFEKVGFEIEPFGQNSFAVRSVPANLSKVAKKDLLLQILDGLADDMERKVAPEIIEEKIASMSCKAAVKGHDRMSFPEVEALMDQLLTLKNPYHCPHGRPTLITMSKRELEKKFKRIV